MKFSKADLPLIGSRWKKQEPTPTGAQGPGPDPAAQQRVKSDLPRKLRKKNLHPTSDQKNALRPRNARPLPAKTSSPVLAQVGISPPQLPLVTIAESDLRMSLDFSTFPPRADTAPTQSPAAQPEGPLHAPSGASQALGTPGAPTSTQEPEIQEVPIHPQGPVRQPTRVGTTSTIKLTVDPGKNTLERLTSFATYIDGGKLGFDRLADRKVSQATREALLTNDINAINHLLANRSVKNVDLSSMEARTASALRSFTTGARTIAMLADNCHPLSIPQDVLPRDTLHAIQAWAERAMPIIQPYGDASHYGPKDLSQPENARTHAAEVMQFMDLVEEGIPLMAELSEAVNTALAQEKKANSGLGGGLRSLMRSATAPFKGSTSEAAKGPPPKAVPKGPKEPSSTGQFFRNLRDNARINFEIASPHPNIRAIQKKQAAIAERNAGPPVDRKGKRPAGNDES
jgi:hypothetical protein